MVTHSRDAKCTSSAFFSLNTQNFKTQDQPDCSINVSSCKGKYFVDKAFGTFLIRDVMV